MEHFNYLSLVIGASLIVIISYFFNILAKKTGLPSVILLIGLGMVIQVTIGQAGYELPEMMSVLKILGVVGLIMILLEAALDLELSKEKMPIIIKSVIISIISTLACSFAIAFIFRQVYGVSISRALFYAIPLAIMSSAIIIPSVSRLQKHKKEFMIYESIFSDTFGIMFFYIMKEAHAADNISIISMSILGKVLITIIFAFAISYFLVFLFQNIQTQVKLFLLIAVLTLLFALGEKLELYPLFIILIFGLILRNRELFFFGKLKRYLKEENVSYIFADFKLLTLETSFILRTFFFLVFGLTMALGTLLSFKVFALSLLILAIILAVRFGLLKLFFRQSVFPKILLIPRGLITILLFYEIEDGLVIEHFDNGIFLHVIIISSLLMAYALFKEKKDGKQVNENEDQVGNETVDDSNGDEDIRVIEEK